MDIICTVLLAVPHVIAVCTTGVPLPTVIVTVLTLGFMAVEPVVENMDDSQDKKQMRRLLDSEYTQLFKLMLTASLPSATSLICLRDTVKMARSVLYAKQFNAIIKSASNNNNSNVSLYVAFLMFSFMLNAGVLTVNQPWHKIVDNALCAILLIGSLSAN